MLLFFLILVLGFFAQYIDGVLGMGYGASSSSFLVATGLVPAIVSASVHTSEIFASFASGLSHLIFGNVDSKVALPLTCTGILGGIVGAYFLAKLPGNLMTPFVGAILLILGIRIFLRFFWKKNLKLTKGEFSKRFLLLLGFVGGAVDAIGGGGWGPICTSMLVSANKTEPRYVIGSVNIAEFFTTITTVFTFGSIIGFENFLWHVTIPLIVGGVIAAPVAAYTCQKVPPRILGTLVGAILITLNTRTITKYLPKMLRVEMPIKLELIVIFTALVLVFLITLRYVGKNFKGKTSFSM